MATSTTDYSAPDDIRGWIATPSSLSSQKCGSRAIFTEENCVVARREPEVYDNDCVVYTRDALGVGRVWQTTILDISWWSGYGLVSRYVLCSL